MSRNFELLQRAQKFVRGTSWQPLGPAAEHSPAPGDQAHRPVEVEPSFSDDGAEDAVTPQQFTLPCASLPSAQKQELIKLVNGLFGASGPVNVRVVGITAVDDNSSTAHIAACTSELLARHASEPVCVIDGDLRDGQLHRQFGLERGIGLADALVRNHSIRNYCLRLDAKLWILGSGSSEKDSTPAEREPMCARLEELRQEFAYCVVVLPPVASGDVLAVGPRVDGVLLVVEADVTRRDAAAAAKEMLANSRIPVMGAILNNRKYPIPQWLYSRL